MAVAFFLHFVFLLQPASVTFLLHGYFANQPAVWLVFFVCLCCFSVIVYYFTCTWKKKVDMHIYERVYTQKCACMFLRIIMCASCFCKGRIKWS